MEALKNKLYSLIVYGTAFICFGITCAVLIKTALSVKSLFIVVVLGVALLCCAVLGGYLFFKRKKFYLGNKAYICILIVVSAFPRLLWVFMADTQPVSDFGHLHDYGIAASNGMFKDYVRFYEVFPFKFSYGFMLAGIYKLFGVNILIVKLLNVILSVALALLIYWVGSMTFKQRAGRTAGLLFAAWPAQIMYTSVLATEHVFIVFFVLGIGLFIKYCDKFEGKISFIWPLLAGASLGLAQLVRPFSTLMLPIFALYLLVFVKYAAKPVKDILLKGRALALILIGFAAVMAMVSWPIERLTGVPAWKSSSGVNLLIGTNYKYTGMFNKEDFSILDEFNYDYGKVHSEATGRAFERVISNPVQFVKLAAKKYMVLWGDEYYGYYWNISEQDEKADWVRWMKEKSKLLAAASQGFYLVLMLFTTVGCIFLFQNAGYKHVVYLLLFDGLFAAYTFLEVQNRYHFPVVPFFIIIAGYGIQRLTLKLDESTLTPIPSAELGRGEK